MALKNLLQNRRLFPNYNENSQIVFQNQIMPKQKSREIMNLDVGVVDPRKSAEAVSTTYLHCILKGLQKSPRIIPNVPDHGVPGLLTASDISCLVIPDGCIGLPTLSALEQGISVIAVKENKNKMMNNLAELPFAPGKFFWWKITGKPPE